MGPVLNTLYTASLSSTVGAALYSQLYFSDHSQLYVTFRPFEPSDKLTMLAKQTACIKDIKRWMLVNMLKMNDCETDCLVISSPSMRCKITIQPIPVGDCLIDRSPTYQLGTASSIDPQHTSGRLPHRAIPNSEESWGDFRPGHEPAGTRAACLWDMLYAPPQHLSNPRCTHHEISRMPDPCPCIL